ncbi:MAG: nickel-responsive regulator [Elusimicrobia bacterium GWF2_52_66]|nr:MAG: nickel-responsive regulator [Elusimicrobia bacterium GWA2_51_34]OGR85233.1 MAG: nickel-responsive regulator [Elusimicrobia bacterium GWF2_52_66]HAF94729.1 nickel-responsive transcriptional regulator NikR [Elusimicrobiota bacterium]HCE97661.1 nickel-responsive transcriptional regulator NikR [Elusimicrobiota bacterium]
MAQTAEKLSRFGVSLKGDLLRRFDAYISREGYTNRSKAIADLIRKEFVADVFARGGAVAGAVTIVYNHHKRGVANKLLDIQYDHGGIIISAQRAHLDHDSCLEIIAVKGSGAEVRALADALKAVSGVRHATLSVTSAGK